MNLKMWGPIRRRPTWCCEETNRQCVYLYKVTPRRFRATSVAVEK